MASLIDCPHCGSRPTSEFAPRGEVPPPRPDDDAPLARWVDYAYLRTNPKGVLAEHWHHVQACRRWLIVTRNTVTHEIIDVIDVAASGQPAGDRT